MLYCDFVTGGLYTIQHSARRAIADKTTRDYLNRMNEGSCLDGIHIALTSAFAGDHYLTDDVFGRLAVDVDGGHHAAWTLNSFTRHVETRLSGVPGSLAASSVPLLWSLFVAAADFPLAPSITLPTADRVIDQAGFRRAGTFLVLRGFELLGARKDGTPYAWDRVETGYEPKLCRLARITFCSLRPLRHIRTGAPSHADEGATEALMRQNAFDGISFAQPVVYHGYPSPTGDDRGLDPTFFDAASRKLSDAGKQLLEGFRHVLATSISLGDLRTLVRVLVMSLCVDQQRWRDGLVMPYTYLRQRSGDVYHARLTSVSPEDDTARLAYAVVDDLVSIWFPDGSGDDIAWSSFEKWFMDNPMFIFLYFELWAAIFGPSIGVTTTTDRPSASLFPFSLANLLSLLGVVTFSSGTEARYRFHMNEHYLLQALYTSTYVLSISRPCSSHGAELHQTLTSGDWFHMLIVRGGDLEPLYPQSSNESRVLCLFVQPAGDGVEMWLSDNDDIPVVQFVWRRPIIQLQPNVVLLAGMAGFVCTSYDEQTATLSLQAPAIPGKRHFERDSQHKRLEFDMSRGILSCNDFSGVPLRLRIVQIDCYRLAEQASFITRSEV